MLHWLHSGTSASAYNTWARARSVGRRTRRAIHQITRHAPYFCTPWPARMSAQTIRHVTDGLAGLVCSVRMQERRQLLARHVQGRDARLQACCKPGFLQSMGEACVTTRFEALSSVGNTAQEIARCYPR